jgi:diamine N-acetyltransferase
MCADAYTQRIDLLTEPDIHQPVLIRPLHPDDVDALTDFFLGLSEATRSCYGPHPFDRETAERLCAAADPEHPDRFVAVLHPEGEDGVEQNVIIGYMILTRNIGQGDIGRYAEHGLELRLDACASFAPVIADAYQEHGLGTQMARHVLTCARILGLTQVILMGGVLHRNPRAKHVYEKLGFREVGRFYTPNREDELNYNMILELDR